MSARRWFRDAVVAPEWSIGASIGLLFIGRDDPRFGKGSRVPVIAGAYPVLFKPNADGLTLVPSLMPGEITYVEATRQEPEREYEYHWLDGADQCAAEGCLYCAEIVAPSGYSPYFLSLLEPDAECWREAR